MGSAAPTASPFLGPSFISIVSGDLSFVVVVVFGESYFINCNFISSIVMSMDDIDIILCIVESKAAVFLFCLSGTPFAQITLRL